MNTLTCTPNAITSYFDVRRADGQLVAVIHNPGPRYWWIHYLGVAPANVHDTRARARSKRAALDLIRDVLA